MPLLSLKQYIIGYILITRGCDERPLGCIYLHHRRKTPHPKSCRRMGLFWGGSWPTRPYSWPHTCWVVWHTCIHAHKCTHTHACMHVHLSLHSVTHTLRLWHMILLISPLHDAAIDSSVSFIFMTQGKASLFHVVYQEWLGQNMSLSNYETSILLLWHKQ